ncbi:MAG TPA: T9SS type A sorting domain-containing protein, partial [Rhodothermales bacterium]|nr:T9SS type A sorting domain-containing protein [Rhodothermales bacterium]
DMGPGGRLTLDAGLSVHPGSVVLLGGPGQTLTLGGPIEVPPGARVHVREGTILRLRDSRLLSALQATTITLDPGVRVGLVGEEAFEAAVFPNPVQAAATLHLALPEAGPVQAEVFDVLGRRVLALEEARTEGEQVLALDAAFLPAGLYVWRVTAGGQVRTGTFTRLR